MEEYNTATLPHKCALCIVLALCAALTACLGWLRGRWLAGNAGAGFFWSFPQGFSGAIPMWLHPPTLTQTCEFAKHTCAGSTTTWSCTRSSRRPRRPRRASRQRTTRWGSSGGGGLQCVGTLGGACCVGPRGRPEGVWGACSGKQKCAENFASKKFICLRCKCCLEGNHLPAPLFTG